LRYVSPFFRCSHDAESAFSCGILLLRTIQPAAHTKQSSRLSKKLKSRQQPRKRGAREKKRKLKRQRRRSEPGKQLNVPKSRPRPTRNVETRRGLRGRKRKRGKSKRGNWLLKRKKIRSYNRTCESFP
jgi:hypothetical protein